MFYFVFIVLRILGMKIIKLRNQLAVQNDSAEVIKLAET